MPKFRVYALYTGSRYLGEVEADDKEQAHDKALQMDSSVCLCHQCAGELELDDNNAQEFLIDKAD